MAKRSKATARTRASQERYKRNVKRLQSAGLLDKIDLRKKHDPKATRAIIKYADFLKGKVAAVSTKNAKDVSKKYGFAKRGNVVLVPRQKREKVTINRKGEIVSKRPNPRVKGQTITRTLGAPLEPPKTGERIYYIIGERKRGLGRIKRTTFAKFDDLLEYLNAYEINWDDVSQFFETEYVSDAKADKLNEKIHAEQRAAYKRSKRRRARERKAERQRRK